MRDFAAGLVVVLWALGTAGAAHAQSNPLVLWNGSVTVSSTEGSQTFSGSVALPKNGGTGSVSNGLGTATLTTTATTASLTLSNLHEVFANSSGSADCQGNAASSTVPITSDASGLHINAPNSISGSANCVLRDNNGNTFNQTFPLSGGFSANATIASNSPTATSATGTMTIIHNGQPFSISSGQDVLLAPGDVISIGPGGSASVTFSDGTELQLNENTSFILTGGAGTSSDPTIIGQIKGFIRHLVKCLNSSPNVPCYRVVTISMACACVRGTDFTINVTQSGNTVTTTTTVTSGIVDQTDLQGNTTTLNAGQAGQTSVTQPTVFAAVLPSSRSVVTSNPATAFAAIINTGPGKAIACRIASPASTPTTFSYQRTNPANNTPVGPFNNPTDIDPGATQTFVFAITPTAAFNATDVGLIYTCNDSLTVASIVGVNTLLLSASNTAVPDHIAVGATLSNDGVARVPGVGGTGVFAIASTNIGISSSTTARARLSSSGVPVSATVCETNPSNGQCKQPPTPTVTRVIANNENTTWTAFLHGNGPQPFDPANARVFFEFLDSGGVVRGSTSAAVTVQ